MNDSQSKTLRLSPSMALRWLTGYVGIPYLARPTFRYEQASLIAASLGLTVIIGNFPQIFAKKGLTVEDWMLSTLVASGAATSMLTALLTPTMRRWRQPAVAAVCWYAAAAMTATVALLPMEQSSGLAFTILACGATGVVMISIQARQAIWQANYPPSMRGEILSRNFILQVALGTVLLWALGFIFDKWTSAYRLLYVGGAVSFFFAGFFMRRIRVRGEALRLKRHHAGPRPSLNPLAVLGVFRRDRKFATYMTLQMILGSSTLAVVAILPKILVEVFGASYKSSSLVLAAPMAAQAMAIPMLGGFFDRTSIFRFRAYGSAMWGVARMMLAAGVAAMNLPIVALSGFVMGIAQSFGRLAWSIGHMSFAKPEDTHLYMGAHLMLTGLRGLTMPFVGMWLYTEVLGMHIIWISGLLQLLAAAGYALYDPHRPTAESAAGPSGPYVP